MAAKRIDIMDHKGISNRKIADLLGINRNTVIDYIRVFDEHALSYQHLLHFLHTNELRQCNCHLLIALDNPNPILFWQTLLNCSINKVNPHSSHLAGYLQLSKKFSLIDPGLFMSFGQILKRLTSMKNVHSH